MSATRVAWTLTWGMLLLSGCQEVLIACAADGTCPAGRSCVEGICRTGELDAQPLSELSDDADGGCSTSPKGGPSPRSGVAGGLVEGALIILHGDDANSDPCTHHGRLAAGAWTLRGCEGWRPMNGTRPPLREGGTSIGWPEKEALFVYGGRLRSGSSGSWSRLSDLWRFSTIEGWKTLPGGGPPGRARAGLGLRPETGELVLFGGDAGASDLAPVPLADVWARKADGPWRRLSLPPGPSRRYDHAAAVSGDGRYLIVFGGLGMGGTAAAPLGDTWRLDIDAETWTLLNTPAGSPTARHGARLLRVPGDPRLLLFGGRDGGQVGMRNDLWLVDPSSGLWQLARPGDLGKGGLYGLALTPAKDPCTRPANFTAVDLNAPPRRMDYLWGWDSQGGAIWLFGGRGDCGPLGDVWRLTLKELRWQALVPNPKGWSCARTGASCETLCPPES